jgi:predicted Rossmann fold flavoprotein
MLRARQNGREFARWRGDLLFTHRGISGPTVLGISRDVADRLEMGGVQIDVDLAPSQTFEALDMELREYVEMHPRRTLSAYTAEHAPERLAEAILKSAEIDPNTKAAYLTQKSRNRLTAVLKGWPLGDVAGVPLEKGEVVAGGVSLDEVDTKSMRSSIVTGLYLCGEVLDIAGPVGGYNLQAAFATGYVAGESAALDAQSGVRNVD